MAKAELIEKMVSKRKKKIKALLEQMEKGLNETVFKGFIGYSRFWERVNAYVSVLFKVQRSSVSLLLAKRHDDQLEESQSEMVRFLLTMQKDALERNLQSQNAFMSFIDTPKKPEEEKQKETAPETRSSKHSSAGSSG